jgi:hypothetical protein
MVIDGTIAVKLGACPDWLWEGFVRFGKHQSTLGIDERSHKAPRVPETVMKLVSDGYSSP